ncbi:E3 ubiquitin-protein ligase PPP1R11 [Tyto alba]|uniref:E3 ubiquitin-protein ligase PPP1R11 n=1 Tax=Tyto alba TaxID=56313 RepID=UPI001C679C87|nr:E3 ubiquitin-protein ligase PPP1R11 [Tyto alba]
MRYGALPAAVRRKRCPFPPPPPHWGTALYGGPTGSARAADRKWGWERRWALHRGGGGPARPFPALPRSQRGLGGGRDPPPTTNTHTDTHPPASRAPLRPAGTMAEAADSSACGTATVTETGAAEPENRSLTLKLRKRKPDKKVEWSSDTVDNEHLGRRSSKCCCIYEKPRAFGESSTESEEEEEEEEVARGGDEGCGHLHCVRGHKQGRGRGGGGTPGAGGGPQVLPPGPPTPMEH